MTRNPLGAALVIGENKNLLGIRTDGDVRPSLQTVANIDDLKAKDIMAKYSKTVSLGASLGNAILVMEGG
jgi:arabinose-5-phosphate isomerase